MVTFSVISFCIPQFDIANRPWFSVLYIFSTEDVSDFKENFDANGKIKTMNGHDTVDESKCPDSNLLPRVSSFDN